jgi:pilus assembly protein CpaC
MPARLLVLGVCVGIGVSVGVGVIGPLPASSARADEPRPIVLDVGTSHHLRLGQTITRVSVGASAIADVAPFPPDQLLVTGKQVGQTTVTVWFGNDRVSIYTLRVEPAVGPMTEALARAFPEARNLRASAAGTQVVLSGQLATAADVTHAEDIARGFVVDPAQIVNLVTVAGESQVQLEVSFAEVSRSALRQVGFNFWTRDQGEDFVGGLTAPPGSPAGIIPQLAPTVDQDKLNLVGGLPIIQTPLSGTFGAVLAAAAGTRFPFSAALSVLSERGYARTLSEPTLVALSGHTASFLAGGEFPIPMPQALGQIGVEYKKFGVQLSFLPTVVGDAIQLQLGATVSDIDFSLGLRLASVTVPGLTERHSETTVRLKDGDSFAIAGLLSDQVRSTVDKVPGLGDLPVLGMLFRSTSYRRQETELLVVVTAHLVRPQGERPSLPGADTLQDPTDLELFLLGAGESREGRDDRLHPRGSKAKPRGPVGFAR